MITNTHIFKTSFEKRSWNALVLYSESSTILWCLVSYKLSCAIYKLTNRDSPTQGNETSLALPSLFHAQQSSGTEVIQHHHLQALWWNTGLHGQWIDRGDRLLSPSLAWTSHRVKTTWYSTISAYELVLWTTDIWKLVKSKVAAEWTY